MPRHIHDPDLIAAKFTASLSKNLKPLCTILPFLGTRAPLKLASSQTFENLLLHLLDKSHLPTWKLVLPLRVCWLLDCMAEGKGGMIWENSTETCILSSVKQITSPDWMHETSAWGWCTGMTQRDRMGRKVGGGLESGWGRHVKPWLIYVNVWQKPLQYCKVISLQLIKINGKKSMLAFTECVL